MTQAMDIDSREASPEFPFRPLNVRDALTYMELVKVDYPEVYTQFLDIMKEFKLQAIDTPGVIARISTLFRGRPNLIQGFNTFLPRGYKIECSIDAEEITMSTPTGTHTLVQPGMSPNAQQQQEDRNPVAFDHAVNYLAKVRKRYAASDPETYRQFLEIIQTYQKEQRPIQLVYEQVSVLLGGSPDLMEGFKVFLPQTLKVNLAVEEWIAGLDPTSKA